MKHKTNWILAALTLVLALMDITAFPARLLPEMHLMDVEPVYFTIMLNHLMVLLLAYLVLHFFCPDFSLGLQSKGLFSGLQKYGYVGLMICSISFIGFYVGLFPFGGHPGFWKVLIEGVIYYIGVAIVEELYVRGLLLNLLERLLGKRPDRTFLAILLSSLVFGLGHIPGTLGLPFYVIASKVVWTVSMGLFLGMLYKKSGSLLLPIILHFFINLSALPYCFSSLKGYAPLTLVIVVPAYVILGIYSLCQLERS